MRDTINTAIGNTDNHGRNTALLKRDGAVQLSPAYDLAPMVLDREGIARTTVWPRALLAPDGTADYPRIVAKLASDPESVARELEARFERLAELPALVDDLGLPASAQRLPAG